MFQIIVSQGRIADRTDRTIPGALETALALESALGIKATIVGTPSLAYEDDWATSLPQAEKTLTGLRKAMAACVAVGDTPIMVANTCSASLASLPVAAAAYPEAVLLWIDAHGDFNTPDTTGTGYLGGMVLAAACGLWESGHGAGMNSERVILVGARDIDPDERALLRIAGVRILPPEEATPEAVRHAVGDAPVWIHVDWDVMEPGHVPADYCVPHGFLPKTLREIFEALPHGRLVGLELAEFYSPVSQVNNKAALDKILDIVGPLLVPERVN